MNLTTQLLDHFPCDTADILLDTLANRLIDGTPRTRTDQEKALLAKARLVIRDYRARIAPDARDQPENHCSPETIQAFCDWAGKHIADQGPKAIHSDPMLRQFCETALDWGFVSGVLRYQGTRH